MDVTTNLLILVTTYLYKGTWRDAKQINCSIVMTDLNRDRDTCVG